MNQAHLTSIYNWWTNIDKELLEKVLEAKKLNPIFKRKNQSRHGSQAGSNF